MKRLFFFVYICFTCLVVQAQNSVEQNQSKYLKLNDVVTIRRNNTYLTTNDNGVIVAHGEANDNALWRIVGCTYKTFSWGDQSLFQFQHIKSEKYLHVNITRDNRNNYRANLTLVNDAAAASLLIENNPDNGSNGSHERVTELHHNDGSRSFHITLRGNTWAMAQESPTEMYIEKWQEHHNTGFYAYFTPENYDFGLVKETDKALNSQENITNETSAQQKQVRFVLDLRDSTYLTCVRADISNKRLLDIVTVQSNLEELEKLGITPTFAWRSNAKAQDDATKNSAVSKLVIVDRPVGNNQMPEWKYFLEEEDKDKETNRQMLTFTKGNMSDDKLAWLITLNTKGKSPLHLKTKHHADIDTWANYVDYLVAHWTYNGKQDSCSMRVMRKSFHTHELPRFEYSISPSTYTFNGDKEYSQDFEIKGIHQHGMAYYDVDERVVDKEYTYGPVNMPLKDDDEKLKYEFKCVDRNNPTNEINWLTHDYNGGNDLNKITLTAKQNQNDYRQAQLIGIVTLSQTQDGTEHPHTGTISVNINQRSANQGDITFNHQGGKSGDAVNKDGSQQVHTAERTIYYLPNQDIQLRLAESNFFGYMRWYDYTTGCDPRWNISYPTQWGNAPHGANGTAFRAINTKEGSSRGLYGVNNRELTSGNANNPAPVLKGWNYTYNKQASSPVEKAASGYHTVACDVSAYTDYTPKDNLENGRQLSTITEPTLSYRQLFYLKPAYEIADKIKTKSFMSAPEYLEDYTYLAAVGVDVHLATQFRYTNSTHESELCYFVYNKDNQLRRIGPNDKDHVQAKWYRSYDDGKTWTEEGQSGFNPQYQVYDYLNIDSDQPDTVIYALKVPTRETQLDKELLIARFKVIFVDINACGPSMNVIMDKHEIEEHYLVLEHVDFSYGAAAPGTNNVTQLNKHLPWEQSTYGYYYPKGGDFESLGETSPNRKDQSIPYYGEYFLVNKMDKDWARAEQHGGAQKGYALYVDGTTEPGRVISLTTNAKICAGQTLYCSAWLCNPCPTSFNYNTPRNPIFRCNVEGRIIDSDGNPGEWEDVSVFFVGELEKGSGWQQIVFPVLSDETYSETRISLYNFATGGSGNDFMVDDITLFASRMPIAAYQAQTNCASAANTEHSTAAIQRIDYTEFQGYGDQYMYYQIVNETKEAQQKGTGIISLERTLDAAPAYSHDNQSVSDITTYGSIAIPKIWFNPISHNDSIENGWKEGTKVEIYETVQEFKDALVDQVLARKNKAGDTAYEESEFGKAYIQSTTGKWRLYVMHIVPNAPEGETIDANNENKYLFERYDYSIRMANMPTELALPDCNMQISLHATQSTEFDLYNGDNELIEVGFLPTSTGNCANDYYTLKSKIKNYVQTGENFEHVRGNVLADWLVGYSDDDIYANTKEHGNQHQEAIETAEKKFIEHYNYSRAQVKTAILYDLRRQDTLNTNLEVDRVEDLKIDGFADPFNYQVIKDLCDKGLLELRKAKTSFYLGSAETARYWVYPIDGTATGKLQNGTEVLLHDCSEPVWVSVRTAESNYYMNVAPIQNENKTELQKSQLPTVRLLQKNLNDNNYTISIPITEPVARELTSLGIQVGNYLKDGMVNFKLSEISASNNAIHFYKSGIGAVANPSSFAIGQIDTIRLRFNVDATISNTYNKYNNETDNSPETKTCQAGSIYFIILTLPDRVVWAPTIGIYDGWGIDGNWKGWKDDNNDHVIQGDELTLGYAPIAGSEVIIGSIPKADEVEWPTIDNSQHYPYIHDHSHYPMHINAQTPACGKIYFAPGAHIHNQHLLQYEQAFVDMQVPATTWTAVSAPLKGMVTGDMFVPHKKTQNYDDPDILKESKDPFNVSEFQGSRNSWSPYAFWQSFYNQNITRYHDDHTQSGALSTNTAEFAKTNSLIHPLTPTLGFQIKAYGPTNSNTEEIIVRLPKKDTEYSYFYQDGKEDTEHKESITRNEQSKQLAYDRHNVTSDGMTVVLTNEIASSQFMFGNPTMAYIDMKAFLTDAENSQKVSASFHYMEDSEWKAATLASGIDRFLPPMRSVLLTTNGEIDAKSLELKLKPEHLTLETRVEYKAPARVDIPARAEVVADAEQSADRTSTAQVMTVYAFTEDAQARVILGVNTMAQDYYILGEDAIFISSGVEAGNSTGVAMSPLNMYTVAENVPMMADMRQGISRIPVSMLAHKDYRTDYVQMAFSLTENWTRECYFCDSITGTRYRIMDGLLITVPMPKDHEARYFIEGPDEYLGSNDNGVSTSTTQATSNTTTTLLAYSLMPNELIVTSNQLIREVNVYDMAGRLIAHQTLELLHCQTNIAAPAGICIVEAIMQDGTKKYTQAIIK